MFRSDILRAKTIKSEVAYLSDLKRVRESSGIEANLRSDLKRREKAFWAEAVGAQSSPTNDSKAVKVNPEFGLQASAKLNRLRYAQDQLTKAKQAHSEAATELNSRVAAAGLSRQRVEFLEKLIAKGKMLEASKNESRMADDLAELVFTKRAMARQKGEAAIPIQTEPAGSKISHGNLAADNKLANTNRTAPVEISSVEFVKVNDTPTLTIKCSVGQSEKLGLSVAKGEGGGLHIVIESVWSRGGCKPIIEREVLKARLSSLGLKISSIEVDHVGDSASQNTRSKRSSSEGEGDEIALT
jgi:hypothetical protein